MVRQALILAAGLGTRLRPLTDDRPKAMVYCAGKPLIWQSVRYLKEQGVERIIINVHHYSDLLTTYIREVLIPEFGSIRISDESAVLKDTGGALVHAYPEMNPAEPVLIFNTDIYSDLDLKLLMERHRSMSCDITLVVQSRESSRKLLLDNSFSLTGWINHKTGEKILWPGEHTYTEWAFSGIHLVNPEIITRLRQKYDTQPFPIIPAYLQLLDQVKIKGYPIPDRSRWMEAGDPARLKTLESYLLQQ